MFWKSTTKTDIENLKKDIDRIEKSIDLLYKQVGNLFLKEEPTKVLKANKSKPTRAIMEFVRKKKDPDDIYEIYGEEEED